MFLFLLNAIVASALTIVAGMGGGLVTQYVLEKNASLNSKTETKALTLPTPTPTSNRVDHNNITETRVNNPAPSVQGVQESKTTPTPPSKTVVDNDPVVNCNSKTGSLLVKRSVCSSNTDCPDGKGGYVFESQEACKSRWQQFGNQLKNVTDEYVKALKEQSALNYMKLQQDQQQYYNELNERSRQQAEETSQFIKDLENKNSAEYQKILQEQSDSFKNLIKTPTPTPCPEGLKLYDQNNMYASPQCRP